VVDARLPFRAAADGVTVSVRVTPRAGRNRIEGTAAEANGGVALKVAVTAPPEDGKANDAVIALLARAWRLPKGSVRIIRGAAARHKTLHIAGDPKRLTDCLAAAIAMES
jgi:uncharacterized protein (TIGR00251 family)